MNRNDTAWIAADWGGSFLRVWALSTDETDDADNQVLASDTRSCGAASLSGEAFEAALLDAVGAWLPPTGSVPVVICGMAGARNGWREAPYRAVPCPPLGNGAVTVPTKDTRIQVSILPGLSQQSPADVMRGEETQLAGLLARQPNADGIVCLPGTHSKWVVLQRGEVKSFTTLMTGELFHLLQNHSALSAAFPTNGNDESEWDDAAFLAAVEQAIISPAQTMARLFSLRANALLHQQTAAVARARLSGYLIGQELAAAREYWSASEVALIAATNIGARYAQALRHLGATVQQHDGRQMTLAGLISGRRGKHNRN